MTNCRLLSEIVTVIFRKASEIGVFLPFDLEIALNLNLI